MSSDLRAILALEVPLIVLLGDRHLKLKDIVALAPGSIIELNKGAEEELTVLVNNKTLGTGTAVKVGENFGIRVTYIGDLKARIAALGAAKPEPGPQPENVGNDDISALAEAMLAGQ